MRMPRRCLLLCGARRSCGHSYSEPQLRPGSFVDHFAEQPEERWAHGFFTDGAYGASPMIIDITNAGRYRARQARQLMGTRVRLRNSQSVNGTNVLGQPAAQPEQSLAESQVGPLACTAATAFYVGIGDILS